MAKGVVKRGNICGMGALSADLANGCFMKGVWALRKWVPLCLLEGDNAIPALASHPIGVEEHFKRAGRTIENISSDILDSFVTCSEEIS